MDTLLQSVCQKSPKFKNRPCPCGAKCILEDIPSRVQTSETYLRFSVHPPYLLFSLSSLDSCNLCLCKSQDVYTLSQVQGTICFKFILLIAVSSDLKAGSIFLQLHLVIFYDHGRTYHYCCYLWK